MRDATGLAMLRFASLLDSVCPRHKHHKQPFVLEPDAPPALAAFFSAVGFSDAVGVGGDKPQEWRPTREASREWLSRSFQEWFSENAEARDSWGVGRDDDRAAWARMPPAFRILLPDSRAPLLSDESTSAEDPPLVELRLVKAQFQPRPERVVERLIRATWSRVMSRRTSTTVNLAPEGASLLGPFFPALYQLAEGIWGMTPAPGGAASAQGKLKHLYYDGFERYIDFVLGQSEERLVRFLRPMGELLLVEATAEWDPETLRVPGFRRFSNRTEGIVKQDWFHAVGRIEGMGVWIQRLKNVKTSGFIVAPENRAALVRWLQSERLVVTSEQDPLPPDIWSEPASS